MQTILLLLFVELFVQFCSWDQAWFLLVFIGNVSILKTLRCIGNHPSNEFVKFVFHASVSYTEMNGFVKISNKYYMHISVF